MTTVINTTYTELKNITKILGNEIKGRLSQIASKMSIGVGAVPNVSGENRINAEN